MLLYVDLNIDQISEGYVILITGLLIVFSALFSLFLVFRYGIHYLLFIYKVLTVKKHKKIEDISIEVNENLTGEIVAVISVAIHMYLNENHDNENPILTIKQAKKSYSPWSSKIYGMQNKL